MEVETPPFSSFDLQSKPPFPCSLSMLHSLEQLRSDMDLDSVNGGDSPPISGPNSVDSDSPADLSLETKFKVNCAQASDGVEFPVCEKLLISGGSECDNCESGVSLNGDSKSEDKDSVSEGGECVKSESEVKLSVANAAVKMQKVYRSYRTRRRLADSAVVAEELWWQAIDFVRLNHRTISFFNYCKPETVISRWNRITLNASKVGKGLSEDGQAQQLAFQHWIEAIDPQHRYGHSLHCYYEEWCKADAGQPFFYWLDVGDGKEIDLEECPRSKLKKHRIKYLGPLEREHYEYIFVDGKIVHKQTGNLLDTATESQGSKWIFVMSASKKLFAGEKKKGIFHHSSFLAGGATVAAGRLEAEQGILKSISAYSGHYRPTDERLDSFLSILKENGVNIAEVQMHRGNEDYENNYNKPAEKANPVKTQIQLKLSQPEIPKKVETNVLSSESTTQTEPNKTIYKRTLSGGLQSPRAEVPKKAILQRINSKKAARSYQLGHQLSLKWSTGAGPRIGCVADYPMELRAQALEFVNLSPRVPPTPWSAFPQSAGLPSPAAAPPASSRAA